MLTAHCLLVFSSTVGWFFIITVLITFVVELSKDSFCLTYLFLSGYEMYTTMRADPRLCFVERVGRPDDKAIDAEQHTGDTEMGDE